MKGPTQVKKPFACSFCDKTFSEKSKVKRHEGTHTGKKPFACSFCGKAFTQKSDKNAHERTHTGGKLFTCSFCGKKFKQKSYIMTHERHGKGFFSSAGHFMFDFSENLFFTKRTCKRFFTCVIPFMPLPF